VLFGEAIRGDCGPRVEDSQEEKAQEAMQREGGDVDWFWYGGDGGDAQYRL
jgi:hypothetical protein